VAPAKGSLQKGTHLMPTQRTDPCWISRMAEIAPGFDDIHLPQNDGGLSQDREWCEVIVDGVARRIRFHDYGKLYQIPGLYEGLFYERLECCSPSRVVGLFEDVLEDVEDEEPDLRVLDVGAGNGMVGDELLSCGAEVIVGIDIIEQARQATLRDRPEVYSDYVVADLTDLSEQVEERLRRAKLNCLSTVAALGFGDIPPAAFLKALDLIDTPGWLAFNIKEDFLCERDGTGFCRLIRQLAREEIIQAQAYRRYRHRLSITGKPLHYVAMVARKRKDVPDHMLELYAPAEA